MIPLYLSMEKVSLEVAREVIDKMTNDNFDQYDEHFKSINIDNFTSNLKNGFVVLTMLSSFIEVFLNTIITSAELPDSSLLYSTVDKKVDCLSEYYAKKKTAIKGGVLWARFKSANDVRNSLIHYKQGLLGEGTFIPDFQVGGQLAGTFLTKEKMNEIYDNNVQLARLIADTFGLKIYQDIPIVISQGKDGLNAYVYDETKTVIDPSRFV